MSKITKKGVVCQAFLLLSSAQTEPTRHKAQGHKTEGAQDTEAQGTGTQDTGAEDRRVLTPTSVVPSIRSLVSSLGFAVSLIG